jgi:hypothetical protein
MVREPKKTRFYIEDFRGLTNRQEPFIYSFHLKFSTRWSWSTLIAGVCTIGGVGIYFRKVGPISYKIQEDVILSLIVVTLLVKGACVLR